MYKFNIYKGKGKRVAEMTARITDYDVVTSSNPKLILRDLELKFEEECIKHRFDPPIDTKIELQGHLEGGFDVVLRGYLGRKLTLCELAKRATRSLNNLKACS